MTLPLMKQFAWEKNGVGQLNSYIPCISLTLTVVVLSCVTAKRLLITKERSLLMETTSEDGSQYVEFAVTNENRFKDLQKVFDQLKSDKDEDNMGDDPEPYLVLFDEQARNYFVWSTPEEDALWLKRWFATPIATRWTDKSLYRGWDFGSMIEAFRNGEYELLSCKMLGSNVARLSFYAYAYPYGGTGCLQALVESFGFTVLMIDDGASPPHPP